MTAAASVTAGAASVTAGAASATARAASGGTTSCRPSLQPGSHVLRLWVGGLWRSTLVQVPSGLAPGQRPPLVLALHGWGGNGPQMARYSGLSLRGPGDSYVAAFPSSHGLGWNGTAARGGPDDLAFLQLLVLTLEWQACTAPDAVLAAGVSNGGGMVALAACRLSSLLTAVVSVAGEYDARLPCHPTRPVSVLEIHGTADQVVPYLGSRRPGRGNGVPRFLRGWIARDACRQGPAVVPFARRTLLLAWSHCRDGTVVAHLRIEGGTHQWPGATPPDPGPRATFCAACVIRQFLALVVRGSPSGHALDPNP